MTENIIHDFEEGIYKYLEKQVEGDGNYYGKDVHASGLDSCLRKTVYSFYNFPKNSRNVAEFIQLEVGNLAHGMIQEAILRNTKFNILGIELKVSDGLPNGISGKLDIIAEHIESGRIGIWDIKSVRPNAFKFGNLIKPAHIIQVNVYRKGWEKLHNKTVDDMFIYVLDRSGTNIPFIGIVEKMDNVVLDPIFTKYLKAVEDYEMDKILPPVLDYEITTKVGKNNSTLLIGNTYWECLYCQFQGITCPRKRYVKKDKIQVGSIDGNGVVKIDNMDFKNEIDKKVREYIG